MAGGPGSGCHPHPLSRFFQHSPADASQHRRKSIPHRHRRYTSKRAIRRYDIGPGTFRCALRKIDFPNSGIDSIPALRHPDGAHPHQLDQTISILSPVNTGRKAGHGRDQGRSLISCRGARHFRQHPEPGLECAGVSFHPCAQSPRQHGQKSGRFLTAWVVVFVLTDYGYPVSEKEGRLHFKFRTME